jgi:hypothetical protein
VWPRASIWSINVFYLRSWVLNDDNMVLVCLAGLCTLQVRCLPTSPWWLHGRPCSEACGLGNNWWRCWLLGMSLSVLCYVAGKYC